MFAKQSFSKLETIQTTVRNLLHSQPIKQRRDENYQVAVFLAVLGPNVCEICDNLTFEAPDDKNDLKKVMKKLEDFCVGDTHEAFESYKFHLRKQEESELIEAYVAAPRKLAKTCNFDKRKKY